MNYSLRIDESRFKTNFEALAQIGATSDGGVHRPTFSDAHLQARDWFHETVTQSGLGFRIDGSGNHIARLDCANSGAPSLLLGSHLDSVPNGGRFDGALGVVSALEVLFTIRDANLSLPTNLEAIDFTDEEGTLVGLLGSSALSGRLEPVDLAEPRGGRQNLLNGLARAGLTENGLLKASRDPRSLAGYLELHIEQGSRLADAWINIGVVTSIVGIGSYHLSFIGRADHAGTTSMQARRDAALGSSDFILTIRKIVLEKYPGCTANVGQASFDPGAFNIVPQRVTLALEYRAPDALTFTRLDDELLSLAKDCADRYSLGVEVEFLGKHPPAPMDPTVQDRIIEAAHSLGLTTLPLSSGAGHDAQSLAITCPAGMIFVPSVGGASHSPREFTEWQDCVNGANVLLQTTLRMCEA